MILCVRDGVARGYTQTFGQFVAWVEANSRELSESEIAELKLMTEITIEGVKYGFDDQAEYL